jgi:hypothetical protein
MVNWQYEATFMTHSLSRFVKGGVVDSPTIASLEHLQAAGHLTGMAQ